MSPPLKVLTLDRPVKVLGQGTALPEGQSYSNRDLLTCHPRWARVPEDRLAAMLERVDYSFGNGRRFLVRKPPFATPEDPTAEPTSAMLALRAAKESLADVDTSAVQALVHGTTTTSRYTGAQGPDILAQLGSLAPSFELKAGCSTSLVSLQTAFTLLGSYDNVLVACAETLSKVIDPQTLETWFLLADAGAAVWLARGGETPDFVVNQATYHTDGRFVDAYTTRGVLPPHPAALSAGGYAMRGDGSVLAEQGRGRYLEMFQAMFPGGAGLERIRWLIPHQVNRPLVQEVCDAVGLRAQWLWSADRVGNVGGTSVLFTLAEALRKAPFAPGDEILLMSVGGGLSFAMQRWTWLARPGSA